MGPKDSAMDWTNAVGIKWKLPHVLNHCMRNGGSYQKWHYAIAQWILKAVPPFSSHIAFNKQCIPENQLRPDIVITNVEEKTKTIIDISVPFEGEDAAFEKAREAKIAKYQPLKQALQDKG